MTKDERLRRRQAKHREAKRLNARLKATSKWRMSGHKLARVLHPAWKKVRRWSSKIPLFWKIGVPVLGLLFGAVPMLSRPSAMPSDNPTPNDPLSAPFLVANDGYLTMNSSDFVCWINDLVGAGSTEIRESYMGGYPLGDIGPNGKTTATCALIDMDSQAKFFEFDPKERFKRADITVIVRFRPDFWPWFRTKEFRFLGIAGDDHVIHWLPMSGGKPRTWELRSK
jgi:hypothetical protein